MVSIQRRCRMRRYCAGILEIVCVILLVCSGCSKTEYPQLKTSLVWETTVPGDNVRLYCMDTGAVDVVLEPQNTIDKRPPEIYVNASGQRSPGMEWSRVSRRDWDFSYPRELPDSSGWIVVDENRVRYVYR